MPIAAKLACFLLLGRVLLGAQDLTGPKGPSVSLVRPPISSVVRGKAGQVRLDFRVVPGFHINSNTPRSEFLIPTTLKLDPPTDIIVGNVSYPAGQEMSFPFSPDEKLSVYTGQFTVGVLVRPLHSVLPIKYVVRGQLRYQACDNAQCYPPKTLPVEFEVKVLKGASPTPHHNPPQSPNVHR